jgi:hypothetical protein
MFEENLTKTLEAAETKARAAGQYTLAWDCAAARDILIADPIAHAIYVIQDEMGRDNDVDKFLNEWLEDEIMSMADNVLESYCAHLLADPDHVEKFMSYDNVLKLANEVLTPEDLRALADEMEGVEE